jgi:hypothetical protein
MSVKSEDGLLRVAVGAAISGCLAWKTALWNAHGQLLFNVADTLQLASSEHPIEGLSGMVN